MKEVLAGTRVLDFTRHMAGPYATVLLGDFGADVIKVESMPYGDPARRIGQAFIDGTSGVFLMWNRSKRGIALDQRKPEAREIVRRLVEKADMLVENFRPGMAEEIGIGWDTVAPLNSRLIYLSISAFGPTGPIAQYPGTDPVVQAMSGVMSVTGERDGGPVLVGLPIADFSSAMVAVQAAWLGLLAREKTGKGQRVDVPMLAALVFGLTTRLAAYWATGEEPVREGAAHSTVAPYQVFKAKDGDIVAGAWTRDTWPRFCEAVGRPDMANDPRFVDNPDRMRHRDQLIGELEKIFITRTVAEWEQRFHDANALFGPVCTVGQALAHPQRRRWGWCSRSSTPPQGRFRSSRRRSSCPTRRVAFVGRRRFTASTPRKCCRKSATALPISTAWPAKKSFTSTATSRSCQ